MIDRLTLLAWFAYHDKLSAVERIDAFADLVSDGLLLVHSDRDTITGLTLTKSDTALL